MNATQLETQGHSSIKGLCMESGAEHATQLETQGHSSIKGLCMESGAEHTCITQEQYLHVHV